MRQRKIKNVEDKLGEFEAISVQDPKSKRTRWAQVFGNDNPIFLEIGCGKGQFITNYAIQEPDNNFIAVEGHQSVVLRALEKATLANCLNIRFVLEYIGDIKEYFSEGELDGIFLNFSDPWPKDRHAKRRLTHGERLVDYCKIVKPGGFIQFKTDNELLFQFTLEQIEEKNLEIIDLSRDLHNSDLAGKNITTEYEDKFAATGKNINYVKIRA